jgi:predicted metal-dependent phosphoesterase TrpH
MPPALLNVELHCHTSYSMDGIMTFASLTRTAARVGLDAVAITDHDTIEGAKEFRRMAQSGSHPLQVIVGEERTLADGSHLIGLFIEQAIESTTLEDAIREVEEQGGLCLIPHPFRRKDGLLRHGLEPLRQFKDRTAGFELFSAKCSSAENRMAAELLTRCELAPFGGSDAHYECDLGECVNEIAQNGDLRSSVQQMFERRAAFRIMGKPQREQEPERSYAPLYYRVKKYIRLPKLMVPAARQCYRRYRNWKFGVGRKALREVYRHA